MIALITGGSGCGKSAYAEALVAAMPEGRRVYVATMRAPDAESERRVARHRAQRADLGFITVECPKRLGDVSVPPDSTVLLEDLPNLLANEMFDGGDWTRIIPDIEALARRCARLVVVTGDVFSDGVAYDESTDAYLRALAQINAAAARLADYAAEVVYTIPVPLKGEDPWPRSAR